MSPDPESLPEDVAALRTLLVAQTAEVAAQKRRLAEMAAERAAQQAELLAARAGLIEQRFEIEALRARLARALRVAFGRSSEKLRTQVEQLELTLTDIDELLGETAPDDNAAVAASPTPPAPPWMRTVSPARSRASSTSAYQAV